MNNEKKLPVVITAPEDLGVILRAKRYSIRHCHAAVKAAGLKASSVTLRNWLWGRTSPTIKKWLIAERALVKMMKSDSDQQWE
jgi:hypothetical protein